jgi:hypothetical protein
MSRLEAVLLLAAGVLAVIAIVAPLTGVVPDTRPQLTRAVQVWAVTFLLWRLLALIPAQELPGWLRRHRFPAGVALVSLVLLLGQRLYVSRAGLGFGGGGDPERFPAGILFNEIDNLFYASFPAQAAEQGVVLFLNPHTLEPNPRVYLNLVFLVVGKLAAALDSPPFAVLVCLGLVAAFAVIFLTYWNAITAGFSERAARWAVILVAFASGVSAPLIVLHRLVGGTGPPPQGADIWFQDALTYSSFYAYPFHTIAYAIVSVVVLLAMKTEDEDLPATRRNVMLAGLVATSYLIASTHPYEAVMLLGSYGLYGLAGVVLQGKPISRPALILTALSIGALPATAMNWWISRQPAWRGFADAAMTLAESRWFWLAGYGVVLWLALAGSAWSFRRRERGKGNWFAIWSLALILLLVVVNVRQSKIMAGGFIAFSITGGFAIDLVQGAFERTRSTLARGIGWMVAAGLAVLLFGTSAFLYALVYVDRPADREVVGIAREIRGLTRESPAVLADETTSLWLTGLAPVRAHASHWALTPDFQAKRDLQARAGLEEPEDAVGDTTRAEDFADLLLATAPDFVIVRKDARAHAFARERADLAEVRCLERYCLYRFAPVGP